MILFTKIKHNLKIHRDMTETRHLENIYKCYIKKKNLTLQKQLREVFYKKGAF